ncbi:MAG: hypothetical protein CFH21_00959 [Alphaproteobacteria bacterium MarineAlpha5_Bin11]|nr:hypothetical protein [Pelagibacteraceae bacterium]PPR42941.1 MAG: hypothetical protein CFH21_00959 [Alphaproteobacteria bacterium MarineAlpha5_Bin11]PPR51733.1 MAG: hypothetical protein CFH20_00352 [Alphaproteobacteria bacterium MarineAlpha5_Bin10]|tara:strand:+ start:1357 stop:2214 length:858 start_codon:yes stop_codon:yes gene_type:complete
MNFNGIIFALIAATLFGLIPSTTKISYLLGANPPLAIIFRYLLAILIIILPLISIKNQFKQISGNLKGLVSISIGSILLTLGLLTSVIYIPVSLVALIFYTYPLIVLVWSFINGSQLSKFQSIGFFSAFIGLGIALGPSFNNLNFIGISLAFLAAIGASTVLIVNEKLAQSLHPIVINAFVNFFCLFISSILIFIYFDINLPKDFNGWYYILFASFCYCAAFYSQLLAVKSIGSTRTSLLLYGEPIIAIISAIILLDESLTGVQLFGAAIVIFSLVITSRKYNLV